MRVVAVSLAAAPIGALGAGIILAFIHFSSFTNDVKHSGQALSIAAQGYAEECAGYLKARAAAKYPLMSNFEFVYAGDLQRRCDCAAVEIEATNGSYSQVAQGILATLDVSTEQMTPNQKDQIRAIGARHRLTEDELREVLRISTAAIKTCFAR